ncbi:MAG: copper homeostasis protein CutC [Anaerolineaceae bacterium]
MPQSILFEACVDSVESAAAAQEGGANRVELCADLLEGGITPSAGMLYLTRQHLQIPIHVLIRPRGGDFCYSDSEFNVMRLDIEIAKQCGANGVVFGILKPDGSVDVGRMANLIALARPLSVTFHRAFDMTHDPYRALKTIINLGIERILTSGQAASALEGAELIGELVQRAGQDVIIMAGAGVNEQNVSEIIRTTGVKEVHGSLRTSRESPMQYRNPHCTMNNPQVASDYQLSMTDTERVRALVQNIRLFS